MNSKRGSVLAEVFVLTLIALVIGVAVHSFRSVLEKIEWVKDYADATTPPPVSREAPAHEPIASAAKTDPTRSPIIPEKEPKSPEVVPPKAPTTPPTPTPTP